MKYECDVCGHVYDETDRWIADAMERGKGVSDG